MPKAVATRYDPEIGHHFGRPDIERIGLFSEMGYMNGKGYVSPFSGLLSKQLVKGRQILPSYPKSKCGNQDGYFQENFQRIFEKEAYLEKGKLLLQEQKALAKKNISKNPFLLPSTMKKSATPGDHYGTFSGKMEAFSPELKRRAPYKKEPRNFLTVPGKKGGPGFADITLSKYPEHSVINYDALKAEISKDYAAFKKAIRNGPMYPPHCPQAYFDPNPFREEKPGPTYVRPKEKKPPPKKLGLHWYPSSPSKKLGGCKAGCFDKWPKHSEDRYLSEAEVMRGKYRSKKVFYPQAWLRSRQTFSVVNRKLDSAVNANSWRNFQPITFANP